MRTVLTTLHSKFIHPSLALPYLAAYCGVECGELLIREFTVHEPKENILAALLAEAPDVVAFSVYLWNRRETLDLAEALSVARPGIRMVLGGPEISFEGPEFFEHYPGISAIVRGEGEVPFRGLLKAWVQGKEPEGVPRLIWRSETDINEGPPGPLLEDLDFIPSPFRLGLADLSRGLVYFETSRGCPYRCAFCMSALDNQVRSFSMDRIRQDLFFLLEREVPKIKLVDRTFNYDLARSREIFTFILKHNRKSHFHFEIGGHLLDEPTLELLNQVPKDMFQFEIGVQSTLPKTLKIIERHVSLERLNENVRRLCQAGNIHLHLDLITGLPGEGYQDVLSSIDWVARLAPHHLQIEPVKLLPGSLLRRRAEDLGIRFDPNPPYTVLGTPDLSFEALERLRGLSRLMDLTFNSGRFNGFLDGLEAACGSLSAGMEKMEIFWRGKNLFRYPLSQRALFENIWNFIRENFFDEEREVLRERLGKDYARSERVVPANAPDFFDTRLNGEENQVVRRKVRQEMEAVKGQNIKVQYFVAAFKRLPGLTCRTILLFLYLTKTGEAMQVKELELNQKPT
jgi:anaerobic magnesium-protoporphyrin IX monomethyl ester cyclase